ncbi:MAG TPA: hypothetical protein ENN77_01705 [Candidatus Wirthbacteria bacterium]|nr:hypothetical protein [Candidatus Wirthbacteria bacterium]
MSVSRITVFVPPEPDNIIRVTQIIGEAGVNGVIMTLNRLYEGNTIRFIVDKPHEAVEALSKNNCLVKAEDIYAIEIDDVPGSLASFLGLLKKNGILYDSLQVLPSGTDLEKAVILIQSDLEILPQIVKQNGYRLLSGEDLT